MCFTVGWKNASQMQPNFEVLVNVYMIHTASVPAAEHGIKGYDLHLAPQSDVAGCCLHVSGTAVVSPTHAFKKGKRQCERECS